MSENNESLELEMKQRQGDADGRVEFTALNANVDHETGVVTEAPPSVPMFVTAKLRFKTNRIVTLGIPLVIVDFNMLNIVAAIESSVQEKIKGLLRDKRKRLILKGVAPYQVMNSIAGKFALIAAAKTLDRNLPIQELAGTYTGVLFRECERTMHYQLLLELLKMKVIPEFFSYDVRVRPATEKEQEDFLGNKPLAVNSGTSTMLLPVGNTRTNQLNPMQESIADAVKATLQK